MPELNGLVNMGSRKAQPVGPMLLGQQWLAASSAAFHPMSLEMLADAR